MFRFSILLLTLSLLAVSSSVFAHNIESWVDPTRGRAELSSQRDVTRESDDRGVQIYGETRWHEHNYIFPDNTNPGYGGMTRAWYYSSGEHVHNYENSQAAYKHDHGDYLSGHKHDPVQRPAEPQSPPQQSLIQGSSPQQDAPPRAVRQLPENQQPVNQQPNNQPTVNYPTVTQPTAVATGGTSEGTSEAGESQTPVDTSTEQNFLRAQQKYGTTLEGTPETQPEPQPLFPIRITEYMVRDWSAGSSGLPQWIEVYNPNTEVVNLKGYTFQYATRRSATAPHKVHTLTLAGTQDGFSIAGGGVAILSTGTVSAWRFSGIEATQVYNLNIDNVLKRGWVLTDADGAEIHRLGRAAFGALGDPVAPLHQNQARVSHQVVPSESPPEVYYYGHREDMGSPGFYEQPAPSAPSAVKRKRVGTWASLKQTP